MVSGIETALHRGRRNLERLKKEDVDQGNDNHCKDDCINPVKYPVQELAFRANKLPPAHVTLFYRVDDSFESLRIVHGEIGENLAVEADVLSIELAHELRVGHTVLTCSSIDTLDPECAEVALLGPAVTVSIGETFLVGVLGYGPNVLSCEEITAGSLENLLAACP